MARKILHLDLDAFFCAVEELRSPTLVGKPFAVGGRPDERGVVASCSYAARRFGIHSAMPMGKALRLCPDLIVISARHGIYHQISESVMRHVRNLSPLVEQVSIDEAFLDATDLPESAEQLARRLQSDIQNELNLPCSIGVASNKLVAKIANDVGKAAKRSSGPPKAITVVPPGKEAEFLAPLPAEALWGVGPKTGARLAEIGIKTIGELAVWPESDLVSRFGKYGHDLARHARGIDDSPIITSREVKSISQETTFASDVRDENLLKQTLSEQTEQVGKRLRQEGLYCATVKIKIRWPDFTTITRQITLKEATDQDQQILQAAQSLFDKAWRSGQAVRLLGVGASGLVLPVRQLSFWDSGQTAHVNMPSEKEKRLQTAIDEIRVRFGDKILQRGSKIP